MLLDITRRKLIKVHTKYTYHQHNRYSIPFGIGYIWDVSVGISDISYGFLVNRHNNICHIIIYTGI